MEINWGPAVFAFFRIGDIDKDGCNERDEESDENDGDDE